MWSAIPCRPRQGHRAGTLNSPFGGCVSNESGKDPLRRRIIQRRKWAVVGGGILGMTVAHRLASSGNEVTLIESRPELGGLVAATDLDGVVWDRYYHVILLSDSFTRRILSELDLEKDMRWVTTRTGCYVDGQHYSISNSVEFLRFPALGWIDKFRLAATILYASRVTDWKRLEKILVSEWLIRCSGKRTFERFWLPLLKAKLGDNYTQTSAAFIWATIQRLYAARRSGLKQERFGYVRGGYSRIIKAFERLLRSEGVEVLCGKGVRQVREQNSRLGVSIGETDCGTYDGAVVTAPAPIASRLCPGLTPEEHNRLTAVRYQGIICASLLLRKQLTPYYVTNILDESIPFTGVIGMSTLVEPSELGGNCLVYLPYYLPSEDPRIDQLTDSEIMESFLQGLETMYPEFQREDVRAFQVSRTRYVCALSTIGYSERIPPIRTSVPGLYLSNSSHILNGTLNVNETVQLAEKTSRLILEENG